MKVLIIGSGTMGTGISQLLLQSSVVKELHIFCRSKEKFVNAVNTCVSYLENQSKKGKIDDFSGRIARDTCFFAENLSTAREMDLIIEAIPEAYGTKYKLLEELSKFIGPETIYASNTSSLSITGMGSTLPYPENVVGLHFFNPAPLMELVEIVKGILTSNDVIDKLVSFTKCLGKSPIIVREGPGFVVNRMLIPMINEAICILADGVADRDDIDLSMKLGAHHPMGPLKLSDLIGNDVVLSIMDVLHEETGDSKYRANPLLRKMVRANLLGRKIKKGFYEY